MSGTDLSSALPPERGTSSRQAFNLPNLLTYARILAVPLIVLCFFLEGRLRSSDFARWSALALFVAASITDYLDGYLARIWKQTSNIGKMLDPIADKLLVATCLLLLAADTDRTIAGWSLWAAIIILCREILVSGLREYLAALKVSVPVTQLAKWKTTMQMFAIGFLLAGPAADKLVPYVTQTGIVLLWLSAIVTLYTGWDYFRAGLKHIVDE
jgi:cardiolipin synthase